jgi:hypothetical protein
VDLSGATCDYACCAGDGNNRNQSGANGAIICGHVTIPSGLGPQSGANGIDQPNDNPPVIPLVAITGFTGYTNLQKDFPNGTSQTFLLGEKHVVDGHYGEDAYGDHSAYNGAGYNSAQRAAGSGYPLARNIYDSSSYREDVFGGPHDGVVLFAFCDGSVHSVAVNIDTGTLARLANRLNAQVINTPLIY